MEESQNYNNCKSVGGTAYHNSRTLERGGADSKCEKLELMVWIISPNLEECKAAILYANFSTERM